MRVAINGFGRIGRLYFRAAHNDESIEVVAINDLQTIDSALHLLKHDSVHGNFDAVIEKKSECEFTVNGKSVKYFSEKRPEELPWKDVGVDLVVECTGVFSTKELSSKHISAGAKKVLISCPSKDADRTIVFGVNQHELKASDKIVSNGSCTTNCLAPIVKILQENFEIENGHLLTIHSYTGDQRIVDLAHKDLRRARAAAMNMIPTSTGASKAIAQIFPELSGKLTGLSIRVPTANVSMIDFVCSTKNVMDKELLKKLIRKYADGELKGVLGYTDEELVSSDFNHTLFSSIVDMPLLHAEKYYAHVIAWYDNEWGFVNRMIDVSKLMGKF